MLAREHLLDAVQLALGPRASSLGRLLESTQKHGLQVGPGGAAAREGVKNHCQLAGTAQGCDQRQNAWLALPCDLALPDKIDQRRDHLGSADRLQREQETPGVVPEGELSFLEGRHPAGLQFAGCEPQGIVEVPVHGTIECPHGHLVLEWSGPGEILGPHDAPHVQHGVAVGADLGQCGTKVGVGPERPEEHA